MALKWTPELVETIESAIVDGQSIASICGSDLFPHPESTFWRHYAKDLEFASVIARAMETRTERDIERCRIEAMNAKADDWQVAQLRIRTYQWEAGKRKPKKYGDKLQTELSGEVSFVSKSILDKE
ncbi:MAG TPA: hypothetical protein VMC85_20840 [Desulfomonilaceae bacterium]|nr:hypothetical protein [Desulfomonilaceae bacterium]